MWTDLHEISSGSLRLLLFFQCSSSENWLLSKQRVVCDWQASDSKFHYNVRSERCCWPVTCVRTSRRLCFLRCDHNLRVSLFVIYLQLLLWGMCNDFRVLKLVLSKYRSYIVRLNIWWFQSRAVADVTRYCRASRTPFVVTDVCPWTLDVRTFVMGSRLWSPQAVLESFCRWFSTLSPWDGTNFRYFNIRTSNLFFLRWYRYLNKFGWFE